MRQLRSLAVVAATTWALTVGGAGAAAADAPTREVMTVHRDIPGFLMCSYGPLDASFDLTREITTFTKDGEPVRRIIHAYGTGLITNPTTGERLDAFVRRVFVLDLTEGLAGFTVAFNTRVPLPTGGTAILGGGQIVFDSSGAIIETRGPDETTEINEICAALA